jgi:hypothetical protein
MVFALLKETVMMDIFINRIAIWVCKDNQGLWDCQGKIIEWT